MGKRSGGNLTKGGTPGGEFPTTLPELQGVSAKQIQFGEDRRDTYIQAAKTFDSLYENVRPIMTRENVTYDEAVDKFIGIDKEKGATIEQSKQRAKYASFETIGMSLAKTSYLYSEQPSELQSRINQAKVTYKDQLIGINKNRLPARINQRIVLDYTVETLKRTIRTETSASKWIELGKL